VWLVAAIGMAVGAGVYFLAAFTAILATAVLQLLRPISKQLKEHALAEERDEWPYENNLVGSNEDEGIAD
jgi:uncharacterized membrane protein YhiD involved in acid resistance